MEKDEHLVEGETVIYSDGARGGYIRNLYLTDKRILIIEKTGLFNKNTKFKDIMFHHISSIEWGTIEHPWLLFVGIGLLLSGLFVMNDGTIQTHGFGWLGWMISVMGAIGCGTKFLHSLHLKNENTQTLIRATFHIST